MVSAKSLFLFILESSRVSAAAAVITRCPWLYKRITDHPLSLVVQKNYRFVVSRVSYTAATCLRGSEQSFHDKRWLSPLPSFARQWKFLRISITCWKKLYVPMPVLTEVTWYLIDLTRLTVHCGSGCKVLAKTVHRLPLHYGSKFWVQ